MIVNMKPDAKGPRVTRLGGPNASQMVRRMNPETDRHLRDQEKAEAKRAADSAWLARVTGKAKPAPASEEERAAAEAAKMSVSDFRKYAPAAAAEFAPAPETMP